jgi:hypothetical protein
MVRNSELISVGNNIFPKGIRNYSSDLMEEIISKSKLQIWSLEFVISFSKIYVWALRLRF